MQPWVVVQWVVEEGLVLEAGRGGAGGRQPSRALRIMFSVNSEHSGWFWLPRDRTRWSREVLGEMSHRVPHTGDGAAV